MKKLLLFMFALSTIVFAVPSPNVHIIESTHLALQGYDPVAYFTVSDAVIGDESIQSTVDGVTYYFSSQEHKEKFDADPEMYMPEYGGYCAYAVSKGELVEVDPKAWEIVDGRLYLNFNRWIRIKWLLKKEEYIELADEEWYAL